MPHAGSACGNKSSLREVQMMLQKIAPVFLALFMLSSCAHKAAKPVEDVAQAKGSISVLSEDKTELLLEGDEIYCVPVNPKTTAFFDAHEGDRFIPVDLLVAVPGVRAAIVDMNNEFAFASIPSGNYYFYWQLPYEKGMDVHNRSITNYLFRAEVSNAEKIKLVWNGHMHW
jgi:hypothetical protein